MKKYYLVIKEDVLEVFDNWEECYPHTCGACNFHKKVNLDELKYYMDKYRMTHDFYSYFDGKKISYSDPDILYTELGL